MKSKNWMGMSSQIGMTNYDEDKNTMTITFLNGTTYDYLNVPLTVWEKSTEAQSIGKFFNQEIKGKYETIKK